MKEKKRGIYIIFSILAVVLLISLASAGIFDSIKRTITGRADQDIAITVSGNNPPTINNVPAGEFSFNPVDPDPLAGKDLINPVGGSAGGDGIRIVTFNIYVEDLDGYADISSVTATFTGPLGTINEDTDCSFAGNQGTTIGIYECSINMFHYDEVGESGDPWQAEVTAESNSNPGEFGTDTWTFVYNSLSLMEINPPSLDWGSVTAGETDVTPGSPTTIINYGNYNEEIYVEAYNIPGVTETSETIPANEFSTGPDTGGLECDETGLTANLLSDSASTMIDNTNANPGSIGSNTEEIYYCIDTFPQVIAQLYSTDDGTYGNGGQSWQIIYST